MFKDYLKQIGLESLISFAGEVELNNFIEEAFVLKFPNLSEREVKKLYVYDVPWVSADGASCVLDKKSDKPYNLAETFGLDLDFEKLKNHPQTVRLWKLNKIVEKI